MGIVRDSTTGTRSDRDLLLGVSKADPAAFEELYRRYELRVYGYIRSLVRDAATAEDLVIETMTEVWRAAARFQSRSLVSTWILGIARHKAIDAIRRKNCGSSAVALEPTITVIDPGPTHEDTTQAEDTRRIVQQALSRLSPEHQEALRLAFYEELPYEQIAAVLGIPANTVKSRVFYAKEQLRRMLSREASIELLTS
jgi:RNA polymerase sigma-70 factor (ECF subfamily)